MAFVYSCCFWFSLRLGGLIISIFSLALLLLTVCCLMYTHSSQVKHMITEWTSNLDLVYMTNSVENLKSDLQKYSSLGITVTCVYIVACLLFIYGVFTFNNMLMIAFLLMEAIRLIMLSIMVANLLLLLKQNTMDIGLLIGASVAGGFLLLGMFYLWVCAVNLPILINEMERDIQAATIKKLQQLLEAKNRSGFSNGADIPSAIDFRNSRNMFAVSQNRL